MKQVFSIGTKLLGVYFIFLAASSLFGILASLISLYSSQDYFALQGTETVARTTSVLFLATIFQLVFGLLALLKTELFIQLADLPEETMPALDAQSIFRIGIMLIGVFIFVENIGFVINDFFLWFFRNDLINTGINQIQLWTNFLKVLFAFSLILFSDQITKLLIRQSPSS